MRLLLAFLENHLPTVKTDLLKQLTQLTNPNKEAKFSKNQLHKSIDNLETAPLVSLQGTPNSPNSIAKFNAIEANLMAIKSYFMDEVYELRNEVSSLKSMLNNLISNRTETDNQIITGTLNNNILEPRLFF